MPLGEMRWLHGKAAESAQQRHASQHRNCTKPHKPVQWRPDDSRGDHKQRSADVEWRNLPDRPR